MPALIRSLAILALIAAGGAAEAAAYQIPENVGYKDVTVIQNNVLHECNELGLQLSASLAAELTKKGVEVQRVVALDAAAGPVVDIKISNLVSAGNAFIGHYKSVSVLVELRQGGERLASTNFTRRTTGAAGGGFKSSCAALERVVLVLGKDVAQWAQPIFLRSDSAPAAAASAP